MWGSMCCGSFMQFRPTMSTPASCSLRAYSATVKPSSETLLSRNDMVIMAGREVLRLILSAHSKASPSLKKSSPITKSTPACASICSSNMSATSLSDLSSSGSHIHVVLRSPATSISPPATSRAMSVAARLISSTLSPYPTVLSFSLLP